MSKIKEPIFYAKAAIATMMRKYKGVDLPPKGHFHYHQGVFLSGVYKNYLLSGEETWFQYVKDWVDAMLDEDGNILDYADGHLDDVQPGNLLFPLIERTGEEKYKKALTHLMNIVWNFPRNEEGGFWHMDIFPNQMWLDGLYMAGSISARYAAQYQESRFLDLAAEQALMMQKNTRDEETGLLCHAFDYNRQAEWADPVTGKSPEFWGRSIGWVPVAILDELDFMENTHPHYEDMVEMVRNLLNALLTYQSESGLWYQVVDKVGRDGNWPEISCSCLYTAALCKAVEKGILEPSALKAAMKGYEGVIESLKWDGDDLLIGGVCIGTGVGDYDFYCQRPVCTNDLHGVGAFLLMCAEAQKIRSENMAENRF